MILFGLIGKNISYSFSEAYFAEKFNSLNLKGYEYHTFDLQSIKEIKPLLKKADLKGLNVTIPYKEEVLIYLDSVSTKAKAIGAVNTIKITKKGKLKGYNTDCYGFKKSLVPHLKKHHQNALILGTGGASKAIAYTLEKLGIAYKFVSRNADHNQLNYSSLDKEIIDKHQLIINCTPLGTYPDIHACPDIPYHHLTKNHFLYDLIYNPAATQFLKNGILQGATTCNGLKMLEGQAEKSWEIWNR
jgi:shikimate dehydrogenase